MKTKENSENDQVQMINARIFKVFLSHLSYLVSYSGSKIMNMSQGELKEEN